MEIISLAVGLIILLIVNIVLGSLSAMFKDSFNRKKFLLGFAKAGIVIMCFAATYLVGYLNPGLVALEINGIQVTVMTAIQIVVLAGYYHYAKQVIEKLSAIVKGDIFTEEIVVFQSSKTGRKQKPSDAENTKKP